MMKGLKGIAPDERKELFINESSEIKTAINNTLCATSAGENGAFNVYKDDDGNIRCELMRYMVTIESKIYKRLSDAEKWVNKAFVRIN